MLLIYFLWVLVIMQLLKTAYKGKEVSYYVEKEDAPVCKKSIW